MADLKRCPFCGSRSIFYDRWYAMHCYSCGAQGPDADDQSNEAAAEQWNRRSSAEVKRLAAQLRECADTLGADQIDEQRAMRAYADAVKLLDELKEK